MFTSPELISHPALRREAERRAKFPPEAALRAGKRGINAALRCDPNGDEDASGCFFTDPLTVTEPSINHACARVHGGFVIVSIFMLRVQPDAVFTSDCESAV